MPPRGRKPRTNPLTVAEPAPAVAPDAPAPICGTCWPDGWAALPEGSDFASCEHGDWSTDPRLVAAYRDGDAIVGRIAQVVTQFVPSVIDGVTTDGVPVTIRLRDGEPALVSLAVAPDPAWSPLTPTTGLATITTAQVPAVSPFKPKPAPEPIDPEELDAGEDVMFMPSGG